MNVFIELYSLKMFFPIKKEKKRKKRQNKKEKRRCMNDIIMIFMESKVVNMLVVRR